MTYKFSVVMPVYNLEVWLEESIGSLLGQSIGFEQNIQLILVNDGSTDGTEKLCLKYRNRYPDNVIYIKQENRGVSAARNAGMACVRGQYVTFFDGDDLWQQDGFERVWNFMQQHAGKTDVVVCAQKLFEAKQGYRETYYKFRDGDRLIRIAEEPTAVELSIVSAFFHAEALHDISFDERLDYGEGAKFLSQVLVQKGTYAVMQSVEYMVRRRADHSSASQNHKLTWQTSTLPYCQRYLCDLADRTDPAYRPYLQHVVLKTLKYRILQPPMDTGQSIEPYQQEIVSMIRRMEDAVILDAPYMNWSMKWFCLKQKHGEDLMNSLKVKKGRVYVWDRVLVNLSKRSMVVREIAVEKGRCFIRGQLRLLPGLPFTLTAKDGNGDCRVTIRQPQKAARSAFWGDCILEGQEFEICILPTGKPSGVRFFLETAGIQMELTPVYAEKARDLRTDSIRLKNCIVSLNESCQPVVKRDSFLQKLKRRF